jgi:hypothetical protein
MGVVSQHTHQFFDEWKLVNVPSVPSFSKPLKNFKGGETIAQLQRLFTSRLKVAHVLARRQ